jgi:hypothetical protein
VPTSTEEAVGLSGSDGLGTKVMTSAPPTAAKFAACGANLTALDRDVQ